MTRIAVLSDIHGNLPALEAVIADMARFELDQVVVAGDIISGGPFSAQVLERVLHERWAAIRGNHEFYLLHYNTPRQPENWANYAMPRYLATQINKRQHTILATMPDTLSLNFPDAPPVRIVHASPRSHWEAIYSTTPDDELRQMLAGIEETTVIFGHCHLHGERRVDQWQLINPGAVGLPLDGIKDASYMLLDGSAKGWTPTFRRVAYDQTPIFKEYARQNYLQQCGIFGHLFMEELKTARTHIVPYYHWHTAHYPQEPHSVRRFQEFLASGEIWDYTHPAFLVNLHLNDALVRVSA